jgi:hypothetical protein
MPPGPHASPILAQGPQHSQALCQKKEAQTSAVGTSACAQGASHSPSKVLIQTCHLSRHKGSKQHKACLPRMLVTQQSSSSGQNFRQEQEQEPGQHLQKPCMHWASQLAEAVKHQARLGGHLTTLFWGNLKATEK